MELLSGFIEEVTLRPILEKSLKKFKILIIRKKEKL